MFEKSESLRPFAKFRKISITPIQKMMTEKMQTFAKTKSENIRKEQLLIVEFGAVQR